MLETSLQIFNFNDEIFQWKNQFFITVKNNVQNKSRRNSLHCIIQLQRKITAKIPGTMDFPAEFKFDWKFGQEVLLKTEEKTYSFIESLFNQNIVSGNRYKYKGCHYTKKHKSTDKERNLD